MERATRKTRPTPRLYRVSVLGSERVTPHMQRVTVGGDSLADFRWLGFDHWFRLFVRLPHQKSFEMPEISGRTWWTTYLGAAKETRPHCSNYTVAEFREEDRELDIEFVVHAGPDGEPQGAAAIWACAAQQGDPLALFDQGTMFDAPHDASEVTLVADESGLPAVTGILRSLPEWTTGRVIIEVPTAADRRELRRPTGMVVDWIDRDDNRLVPGRKALDSLHATDAFDGSGYAFVIGESTLATEGRRHFHRSGLPKSRITFSGFWKAEKARAREHE